MSHYKIGCDAHRRYSQFAILDHEGRFLQQVRVNHMPGSIRGFLEDYPQGTPVALESVGNWYWIVDEIEAAGCIPLMAHAAKAKVIDGQRQQDRQAGCQRSGHSAALGVIANCLAATSRDQR